MKDNLEREAIDNPIDRNGGLCGTDCTLKERLCEALLKEFRPGFEARRERRECRQRTRCALQPGTDELASGAATQGRRRARSINVRFVRRLLQMWEVDRGHEARF